MLFFILVQEPYELNKIDYKINFKSLEAKDIKAYEFSNGLDRIAIAKEYYKLGEQDNIIHLNVREKSRNLKSEIAIKEGDYIYLKNNVNYEDLQTKFKTNKLDYKISERKLSTDEKSSILYNDNTLFSDGFEYFLDEKKLRVKKVELCIEQ